MGTKDALPGIEYPFITHQLCQPQHFLHLKKQETYPGHLLGMNQTKQYCKAEEKKLQALED